jgi:hypothetical protein
MNFSSLEFKFKLEIDIRIGFKIVYLQVFYIDLLSKHAKVINKFSF